MAEDRFLDLFADRMLRFSSYFFMFWLFLLAAD